MQYSNVLSNFIPTEEDELFDHDDLEYISYSELVTAS